MPKAWRTIDSFTATALALALLGSTRASADDSCGDHQDAAHDHDGTDLRTLAARVVAWRETNLPPASDPSKWEKVQLLGFNDFHGALSPRSVGTSLAGGAAYLAAYLDKAAAEAPGRTIIVHAGDHVGASPPSSALLQDEPAISFLNLIANRYCDYLRLDPRCNMVGTPGNHEFDEGKAEMLRLIFGGNHPNGPFLDPRWRGAKFSYVSANVVDSRTGFPILPPFIVRRAGNINVAFIGAVLKATPTIVTPSGVAGLTFLDEADAINKYVPYIKALGIKSIVVTIHQGGSQTNNTAGGPGPASALNGPAIKDIVGRLDGEVDVVISGHAHSFTNTLLPNAAGKPVLVTQAFANGTAYADIDLEIDPATKEIMAKQARVITTFHNDQAGNPIVTPNAAVAALVAAADARVAPVVNQAVGTAVRVVNRTQTSAGESELGNFIADAQRWKMNTQLAFMNPGGVRADLDAGPVTWGELFAIQPFGNDLVTMTMTGQQVLDLLHQQFVVGRILHTSGLTFRWSDADGSGVGVGNGAVGGALISATTSAGAPIDPAAEYTVTANSFLASGGDGFTVFNGATNKVVGAVDLAGLVDYVTQLPQPFDASVDGRVQLVP